VNDDSLTLEQKSFANHDSEAFVQACPGSGKTRSIVARLANIAEKLPPRRAVAALSFTNSAVEKFSRSCHEAGLGFFLRYPHFVGTFDSFVRHFIVVPPGISGSTSQPIVLDSWETLGIEVRLSGHKAFKGGGVSLDKFDAETGKIDPLQVGVLPLRTHVIKYQSDYEQAAARFRYFLRRKHGLLSASDARVEARQHIRDDAWSQALGRALAGRFYEVIVDEAQDCNPHDLEILSWLRTHGLRVTVVCDPDQAIFEFRHGTPSNLRVFTNTYRSEDQLSFTGNFRSSPPICALAATLRARQDPDVSLGETANITHPVILTTYSGRLVPPAVGQLFIQRLESEAVGLSRTEAIVLAHQLRDALRATGNAMAAEVSGTSRVETLARAVGEFWWPSATTRARESSLRKIEKLLLELMGWWQDGDYHVTRVIERAGLSRRQLRRQALEMVMRIPNTCDDADLYRDNWIEVVRSEVERLRLVLPRGKTVTGFFPCPRTDRWSEHLLTPTVAGLPSSTVHEAKGKEYEAVCVVLKPDRAPENHTSQFFDAWEKRTDLEAKRVCYVGVTRAKKFVMLAVPEAFADRCAAVLQHGDVPYERIQADG
jgi:DNA helicase-2/ATP-dependent DNA helicase PcrA